MRLEQFLDRQTLQGCWDSQEMDRRQGILLHPPPNISSKWRSRLGRERLMGRGSL